MNILYLIDESILNSSISGVVKKVKTQILFWINEGHSVYVFSINDNILYDASFCAVVKYKNTGVNLGRFGILYRLYHNSFYLNKVSDFIDIDIVYMRYMLYTPFLSEFISTKCVVMEINGNDMFEYKLSNIIKYYYNYFFRKLILNKIKHYIYVSHELKDMYYGDYRNNVVISNGADVLSHPLKNNVNSRPKLVFVGSPGQPWQGFDVVVEMSKLFLEYDFVIIGICGENTSNLEFKGKLTSTEVLKEISKADVGIGTLCMYKYQKMKEASPLKTRDYFSCGLPVVYAYNDTDLTGNEAFALKLEEGSNLKDNYYKIYEFVSRVFRNHQVNVAARNFAEKNLDVSVKERLRLSFFNRVLLQQ